MRHLQALSVQFMLDGTRVSLTSFPHAEGETKLALCRDCNWGGRSRDSSDGGETHAERV